MIWLILKNSISYSLFFGLVAYFGILLYLFLNQDRLIFLPTPGSPILTPAHYGIDYESHTLPINDEEGVHLWFIPGKEKQSPVLLFCHGNSGNLGSRIEILKILYQLGIPIVMFDYRGYGESHGRPSEKHLYEDGERVLEFLKIQKGYPFKEIVVMGRSLGGAVACELAYRHPELLGLILDSTFTSLPEIAQIRYPYVPVSLLLKYRFDNLSKVQEIPIPKLIIHSVQDEVIPFSLGERLFQRARSPKRFLSLPAGGHNDAFLESQEIYLQGLKEFLDEVSSATSGTDEKRDA